ncbi:hypothetical protein K0M31_013736 [Melipona bicolor]|uniref:Uncharacterized protein n=1 Tax=Melipona bicolor TaxID=60889 RepID=A0AA40FH61_9HYME|nr:hypothetical protein K0M31_013736 [Melipona bicolor]
MDNVHPEAHVASVSAGVAAPGPPRETHRGLAAAVVEKLDVRAAKMPVGHAVEHIVEAGFREGEPGEIVEDAGAYRSEGVQADGDAERQPEYHEHHAAVHVRLGQLVVPGEGDRRLVGAPGGVPDADHQLHVEEGGR